MEIRWVVIVESQLAGRSQKGGIVCKILYMNKFDSLMIILVKYEEQQGITLTMVAMIDKE